MRMAIGVLLALVGTIHLMPLVGVLGSEQLATLYAIEIGGPDEEILMRHRAVLFGILGGLLILGAVHRPIRVPALAAGFLSVISFLVLAETVGSSNEAIARVVAADWIALGCLVAASILHALESRRPASERMDRVD